MNHQTARATKKATIGISAIFKNEAPYIIEWLAHHRLTGIRHFFIANNESNDQTSALLESLQTAGYLKHHQFPSSIGLKPQIPAYEMLLHEHGHEVDWMAFIDADELIWPTEDNRDFSAFLTRLGSEHPDVGALALNWAMYGSSGQIFPNGTSMTNRFTRHAEIDNRVNGFIKSVVRVGALRKILGPHHVQLQSGARYLQPNGGEMISSPDASPNPMVSDCLAQQTCWDHFRLNHYAIKSYAEFLQKRARGRAFTQSTASTNNQFFMDHDFNAAHTPIPRDYQRDLNVEIQAIALKAGWPLENIPAFSQKESIASWSIPQYGSIEAIEQSPQGIRLLGWVAPWGNSAAQSLKLRINEAQWLLPREFTRMARPDVVGHHPQAPEDTGFVAEFSGDFLVNLKTAQIEVRATDENGLSTDPIALGKYVLDRFR